LKFNFRLYITKAIPTATESAKCATDRSQILVIDFQTV